jgi:hypothetical protein
MRSGPTLLAVLKLYTLVVSTGGDAVFHDTPANAPLGLEVEGLVYTASTFSDGPTLLQFAMIVIELDDAPFWRGTYPLPPPTLVA